MNLKAHSWRMDALPLGLGGKGPARCRHSQQRQWTREALQIQSFSPALRGKQASRHSFRRQASHLQMYFSSRGPKMRLAGSPLQATKAHLASTNFLVSFPAMMTAACTALIFLAAAALCIFLLLRPLLKRLEALAIACESAAKEVEKASAEFALASGVINNDLPTTLDSMERASLEFEELGQSLNGLTGALRRTKPSPGKPVPKGKGDTLSKAEASQAEGATDDVRDEAEALHEWSAVEAIQASTVNSMRKVAQDVSALATALTPAMVAWRKRLSFITERFETSPKADKPKELPAPVIATESKDGEESDAAEGAPVLTAAQDSEAVKEGPEALQAGSEGHSWQEDVQSLQDRVMSQAESGQVSDVANELAKAATEVADVARASLSSTDEEEASELGLTPEEQREGADLLEKASMAAQALKREAQKAAEVESKFQALKDIAPLPEDLDALDMPSIPRQEEGGLDLEMEDRRKAAEAVFTALANAEEAASAAAAASGALETALQKAEQHAGISWWGWNNSLFRPASKKKRPKADVSEAQEHDGMAYPCSRYIASRETEASKPETAASASPNNETS